VKPKDEKESIEYRTKWVILEIYDEMRRAMETGVPYETRLVRPPADAAVAHEGREGEGVGPLYQMLQATPRDVV
jgi:hypothetical protein